MSENKLAVLAVIGSMNQNSVTRTVVTAAAEKLRAAGCAVDVLDLLNESLPLYNPDTAYEQPGFSALKVRVATADVILLGTPDYHGSVSGVMKNFLDHFWKEFTGKLIAPLVASHEKGLTVIDQLRTVARQCYAWTLPYGISFMEKADVNEGRIVSDALNRRIAMSVRDLVVYGRLLAR